LSCPARLRTLFPYTTLFRSKWHESALNTIYRMRRTFVGRFLMPFLPRLRHSRRMLDTIIWDGTFHGRFEDRQYAIDIFNRHNEEDRKSTRLNSSHVEISYAV